MQRAPQFVTGDFEPHWCFLPDDEYGRALDALVKACSDVLITTAGGGRVLLGKRNTEPQPDWWYFGGRVKPGMSPEEGAAKNVKRELGLDKPASEFKVIANYSFVWKWRAQAPADHGTADISTIHNLELESEAEVAHFMPDPKEYDDFRWFDTDEVLAGEFHPALKAAIRDLRAANAHRALEAAVQSGQSAADISELAKVFVTSAHRPSDAPIKVKFEDGKYTTEDLPLK
mmetsp:Transcript_27636/g.72609  ORF Transcript_27636/g.72609 Transcript_27636/m.72609 type:complete len:230 (-) Transcript_27636:4-693(-)